MLAWWMDVVREAETVRAALAAHQLPLVACHCDPLCENFLDSGDQVRCFFEEEAFDAAGRLRVPKALAMPGRQHFSMLDALCDAAHPVHHMACDLLGVRPSAA